MRQTPKAHIVAALAAAAALAACAAPPAGAPADPARDAVVRAALADAERASGLAAAQLVVVSADRVVWPDGSLGCPQPDVVYTQALVPGWRVRIRAGEVLLDYHASLRGAPVPCPPGRAREPLPAAAVR